MEKQHIRVVALGFLRRPDGAFLVEKGFDRAKNEVFYRPLGGGVEFGETGAEALKREFMEEIGQDISVTKRIKTCENIFTYDGQPGHQIMLLYEAVFTDPALYEQDSINRIDHLDDQTSWKTLEEIEQEGALLHPWQMKALL